MKSLGHISAKSSLEFYSSQKIPFCLVKAAASNPADENNTIIIRWLWYIPSFLNCCVDKRRRMAFRSLSDCCSDAAVVWFWFQWRPELAAASCCTFSSSHRFRAPFLCQWFLVSAADRQSSGTLAGIEWTKLRISHFNSCFHCTHEFKIAIHEVPLIFHRMIIMVSGLNVDQVVCGLVKDLLHPHRVCCRYLIQLQLQMGLVPPLLLLVDQLLVGLLLSNVFFRHGWCCCRTCLHWPAILVILSSVHCLTVAGRFLLLWSLTLGQHLLRREIRLL